MTEGDSRWIKRHTKKTMEQYNMNRFYKKAKPETIEKRKQEYNELYSKQIEWFEANMKLIKENTFLVDMYTILTTGSRPISEKMLSSINASMNNWRYDPVERTKREEKFKPILEKINMLKDMVEAVDGNRIHTRFSAYGFVTSLMEQAKGRLSLSEKQMSALNKCWKKYKIKFEDKFENSNNNKEKK